MERQLQQQCQEVSVIRKRMHSKSGNVATNKTTATTDLNEHGRRRQTCNERAVISSDDEQPELPGSSRLRLTDKHKKQLESSPWKNSVHTQTSNLADGHSHQLEEVLPHPRTTNPVDNSKQSELRRMKKMNSYPECGKRFNEKCNLTVHSRIQSGEKPKCSTCNTVFSCRSHLTRHQKIHSGEKPFKCSICNATFGRKSNLTKHKRIHSREKPFKCSICNAAFYQKGNLTRHQRIHSGEKPFVCTGCSAAFSRKDKLNVHQNEKPCKYLICKVAMTPARDTLEELTNYQDP